MKQETTVNEPTLFGTPPATCDHGRTHTDCPWCATPDPRTLAHTTDPTPSHIGAARAALDLNGRRRAVYDSITLEPATADELDDRFPQWPPRTAARRLSDLKQMGLVAPTGERRLTRWGQPADVYGPT